MRDRPTLAGWLAGSGSSCQKPGRAAGRGGSAVSRPLGLLNCSCKPARHFVPLRSRTTEGVSGCLVSMQIVRGRAKKKPGPRDFASRGGARTIAPLRRPARTAVSQTLIMAAQTAGQAEQGWVAESSSSTFWQPRRDPIQAFGCHQSMCTVGMYV